MEEELQQYLTSLEEKLRSIQGWLLVVYLMDEIRKTKAKLEEVKLLEYKPNE